MKDYIKEKIALEEAKEMYRAIYANGDILDKKATALLSNSSLILTLFSVLQISLIEDEQTISYKIGLAIVVALFLSLVIIILCIIRPKKYHLVFEFTWNGIVETILDQKKSNVFYQLISNYIDRIQHNEKINRKKSKWLNIATYLFSSIILMMIFLSLYVAR
jgi:hypothetical protein